MEPTQQTALLFLILVASTVHGLRREFARTTDGYTEISHTLADYIEDNFAGFSRRQSIRFQRIQALRKGG